MGVAQGRWVAAKSQGYLGAKWPSVGGDLEMGRIAAARFRELTMVLAPWVRTPLEATSVGLSPGGLGIGALFTCP